MGRGGAAGRRSTCEGQVALDDAVWKAGLVVVNEILAVIGPRDGIIGIARGMAMVGDLTGGEADTPRSRSLVPIDFETRRIRRRGPTAGDGCRGVVVLSDDKVAMGVRRDTRR